MTTPASAYAENAAEDATAVLVNVMPGLFLGNGVAAQEPELLEAHGITQVLNLAVNMDLAPMVLSDGTVVRMSKVGLIDGAGNDAAHLLAAALAIRGMRQQIAPGKPSYPDHREGGLLVNCRGGRSRSVSALALYLTLFHQPEFPDTHTALAVLRSLRGLPLNQPRREMVDLIASAMALTTQMA